MTGSLLRAVARRSEPVGSQAGARLCSRASPAPLPVAPYDSSALFRPLGMSCLPVLSPLMQGTYQALLCNLSDVVWVWKTRGHGREAGGEKVRPPAISDTHVGTYGARDKAVCQITPRAPAGRLRLRAEVRAHETLPSLGTRSVLVLGVLYPTLCKGRKESCAMPMPPRQRPATWSGPMRMSTQLLRHAIHQNNCVGSQWAFSLA